MITLQSTQRVKRIAALAALAASAALVAAITIGAGKARGDELPACPVMSYGQFADRLDEVSKGYRDLLLAYRRAPHSPLPNESFVFGDIDFLDIAAACLRQQESNRLRALNGLLDANGNQR